MPAAPKHHRAAPIAVPRLPLSAIIFFAVTGLGGSLFLTYTSSFSSGADAPQTTAAVSGNAPVYSVRAVPFDPMAPTVADRAIASAQTAAKTEAESARQEADEPGGDPAGSEPLLFADADHHLKGSNRFSSFGAANNQLTITGTTFGMLASTAPSYIAPDADSISAPVPESSTGWYAAVVLVFV